jgi:hypothetical protein
MLVINLCSLSSSRERSLEFPIASSFKCRKPKTLNLDFAIGFCDSRDSDILETSDISFSLVHSAMLMVSARARILWGHAPRVRSAAAFRRGLATVADHTDSR